MIEENSPAGFFHGQIHILPVRVYYEDTDFTGVVYHANYLRYMERGRSDCLRCLGIHHHELWAREEPLAFTIKSLELEYMRAAKIDDVLEIRTLYTEYSGARLKARQAIFRDTDEIVQATLTAACINRDGKPRRLPDDIVERIKAGLRDA